MAFGHRPQVAEVELSGVSFSCRQAKFSVATKLRGQGILDALITHQCKETVAGRFVKFENHVKIFSDFKNHPLAQHTLIPDRSVVLLSFKFAAASFTHAQSTSGVNLEIAQNK